MKQEIMASWNLVNPPRTKTIGARRGYDSGRSRGLKRGLRSKGIGSGAAYPILNNDCDLVYNHSTGQMEPKITQQMGISLNPVDWFTSQDTLDIENGDKVLKAYYTGASIFSENFQYGAYEEFREAIGGDTFVGALGANVRTHMHPGLLDLVYFPYDDAAKRVQDLASSTQGRATPAQINQAAIDTTIDPLTALSQAATSTATNLASGISSTSTLLKYLPILLLVGAGAYIYLQTAGVRAFAKRMKS